MPDCPTVELRKAENDKKRHRRTPIHGRPRRRAVRDPRRHRTGPTQSSRKLTFSSRLSRGGLAVLADPKT